jgi:hypothetical protein
LLLCELAPIGSALKRDLAEGADFVLVKPALFYGDIVAKFAAAADVPVAVYIVSGEYKMLTDYGNSTGTLEVCFTPVCTNGSLSLRVHAPLLFWFLPSFLHFRF